MDASSEEATTLPRWPQIDPEPFKARSRQYRRLGLAVLAVWVGYIFAEFVFTAQRDWWFLLRYLVSFGIFAAATGAAMVVSEELEDRAKSAQLVNSIRMVLRSERKYILLLRSFHSKIVSETKYRVRRIAREETRMIRGEVVPTGETYTDFEHSYERVDSVVDFLVSAASPVHIVIIDGYTHSLSAAPLCILSSDETWQNVFEELKTGAQLVVLVPEDSASLIEETKKVVVEVPNKAVFLMPPSSPVDEGRTAETWTSGMTRRDRWAEFKEHFPVALPEYSERGGIFRLSRAGCLSAALEYVPETVAHLLEDNADEGVPLARSIGGLHSKGLFLLTLTELDRRTEELVPRLSKTALTL